MTGAELNRALVDLEAQAGELAVEVVRKVAEVRTRLAILEEVVAIGGDCWEESARGR